MILEQLRRLSSAEDIFDYLGVAYDPALLRVARLHILKRMGQYLAQESLAELDDGEARVRCTDFLKTAYEDFRKSSPIEERVFKVLRDAVTPKKNTAFVPLTAVRRS